MLLRPGLDGRSLPPLRDIDRPGGVTVQIRAKAPWRRRPNRYRAPTSGAQHSIVRPFVHRFIASYDIYVLPFTTQVKHTMMPAPARNLAFELEVIFCVQGVATAPCGVPSPVSIRRPSSSTPAVSHFEISRTIRRSPIRCSTKRISKSRLTLSKKD